jgi:hypothetical protein
MSGAGKCDSFSGGQPDRAVKGGGEKGRDDILFLDEAWLFHPRKIHKSTEY